MTSLDRLNLRPQERRLLVIVALIVFVVLNFWFVRPRFHDWSRTQADLQKGRRELAKYRREIAEVSATEGYQRKLEKYKGEGGNVPSQDQAIQLLRIVQTKAAASGVQQNGITPVPRSSTGKTNEFFEEQSLTMNFVNTGEKELVDFLYNLGANDSLLRVRDMTIRPELPNAFKLSGSVTLTASFQKNPPVRPATPTATKSPATPATTKPGAPAPAVKSTAAPGKTPGGTNKPVPSANRNLK